MAFIGRSPTYGNFETQTLTPDSVTTSFALTFAVGAAGSILVVYGGVVQQPNVSYTIGNGGQNIVFSEAPVTGTTLYIVYMGKQLTTARTASSDVVSNQFTGTGSDSTFTLTALPPNQNCVLVFVDGIQQRATTNYTVSGYSLVFTTAPDLNAEIDAIIVGTEVANINNVADNSISTAKIQDYAVTAAKLEPALAMQITNQDLGSITASVDLFSIDCGTLV